MNTNKKSLLTNNGWVLCPSKSFSGKMYYFNVQTGEAVWTLGDNEITNTKKDGRNVQRVNSFHNYPEPSSPPDYSPDVTPTNVCPSTSNIFPNHNQTYQINYGQYPNQPIFGQPPQYVTQLAPYMPGMQNVVWTPIQLPTPRWPYCPEDKKPMVDRITQTSMIDRELFVQTSGKPFCQRFVNYEVPSLTFNEKNKLINRSSNFAASTPIKNSNSKMEHSQNQVPISKFIPEPILNMETESHSSFIKQSTLDRSDKSEIFETEMPRKYCAEKPSLFGTSKVQNRKPEVRKSPKKDINDLHDSDLRFLLMAKRKKLEEEMGHMANKKPKLQAPQTPKKRVTFNLENVIDSMSMDNENSTTSDQTPECQTSFYKITMSPTQTMLNYYSMLEHKNPTQNNMPNHSMPTRNILQKVTAKNEYTPSCQDNTPRNNFTNNNNHKCDMTIKRRNVNYTLTGNMPADNTSNMPKYVSIKDDNRNNTKNATPILKKALCNNPIDNNSLAYPKSSQNDPAKTITVFKEANKRMPPCNTPIKESTKYMPDCNLTTKESDPFKEVTKSMPNSNMAIKESGTEPVLKEVTNSCIIKDVWYLLVDMDVLLDDLAMVDQLLMSDEKCKLLIPQCIRKDIEALCIGDSRGQQRVLVARQMSRRMSAPQKQCIVLPPNEEDIELTATDAILNTCTRFINDSYYVVLISNDPDLEEKAKTLNIMCYKPHEIKNGVRIGPRFFSELKKIKIIVDNDTNKDKHSVAIKDNPDFSSNNEKSIPVNMFKKHLFVNDKRTDKNCDILINITKPKIDINSLKFNSNLTKFKINNHDEIKKNSNSHHSQDFEESQNDDLNNTDTRQNENADPKNQFQNLENIVLNPKSDNNQNLLTDNSNCLQNEKKQGTKMTIASTPIINNTKLNDVLNSKSKNTNNKIQKKKQEKSTTKINEILKKTVNSRTLKINSSLSKFKIPKLLPLKRRINTSAPKQSSNPTENDVSNFKNSVEGRLTNFIVKSKMMHEKIETRMDEWTCTYTQIMEDLLNDILQASPKYKKMDISYSNLHESLTCLKMLYNDKELKSIVELLVEMLDKCSCSKGKIKLDTTPKDFMKIIGCGILLVEALKTILPTYDILTDYESYLNGLLTDMESKAIALDPELLRPSLGSRSFIEDTKEKMNFLKDPAQIIEYLKKHYKEWASYDENQEKENGIHKNSPNVDFTVVRMIGKNLNQVKIDNNKCISYAKSNMEKEYTKEDETKVIKLLQNDKRPAEDNTDQVKKTKSILRISFGNQHNEKQNAGSKIIRLIENVSQNMDDENAETNGMRNIDFKKEPLDLDQLDYEIGVTADQNSENIMEHTDIEQMIENDETYAELNENDSYANENDNYANENDNYANENDNYGSEVLEFDVNAANKDNDAANDDNEAANVDNQLILRDDSTNDSGIENDSTQAYGVLNFFLIELSNTFKVIYEFITDFVKEIRGEAMCDERKNHLHLKSSRSLQDMVGVSQQLRSIMKRESQQNTRLKSLFLGACTKVKRDTRIRRYKQIIIKCMEQAEILEKSLRSIVSITIGDIDDLSNNAGSISIGVKYINIFE